MEYSIGLILSLAVAGFAAAIGFDRERAFYSTVLIVIASYYVLRPLRRVHGATSATVTGTSGTVHQTAQVTVAVR
jgi:hypothetical protein